MSPNGHFAVIYTRKPAAPKVMLWVLLITGVAIFIAARQRAVVAAK
jgi:hypothetical protein